MNWPRMDSEVSETLKAALRSQGIRLHQHEEQLTAIKRGVKDLTDRQVNFQASVSKQVKHLASQLHRVLTHLEAGSSAPSLAVSSPPAGDPIAAPSLVSVSGASPCFPR